MLGLELSLEWMDLSASFYGAVSKEKLSDPHLAPPRATIKDLIHLVDQVPQLEIPVTHYFSPGIYMREITMPAGCTGVGHIHKHRHQNIALAGKALVTCDGITRAIEAPFVMESQPGAQKAFQVIEDLRWITIHSNPDDITDIVEIERLIFELDEDQIKSGLTVDEYRMKKQPNSLCLG